MPPRAGRPTRRADAAADAPRRRAVAKLFALADRSERATHREVASIAFWGEGLENRSGVDLLKWMENQEVRGAFRGQPAYDFAGLWAELGLDRPGRRAGSAGAGPPGRTTEKGH